MARCGPARSATVSYSEPGVLRAAMINASGRSASTRCRLKRSVWSSRARISSASGSSRIAEKKPVGIAFSSHSFAFVACPAASVVLGACFAMMGAHRSEVASAAQHLWSLVNAPDEVRQRRP